MNQYYVETVVRYTGTIEANSKEEAEELGYYYLDNGLQYESVEYVDAECIVEGSDDEDNS